MVFLPAGFAKCLGACAFLHFVWSDLLLPILLSSCIYKYDRFYDYVFSFADGFWMLLSPAVPYHRSIWLLFLVLCEHSPEFLSHSSRCNSILMFMSGLTSCLGGLLQACISMSTWSTIVPLFFCGPPHCWVYFCSLILWLFLCKELSLLDAINSAWRLVVFLLHERSFRKLMCQQHLCVVLRA